MMRVLVIKMSSMGDVIHTLPALTDAAQHIPGIEFDWLIESDFAEIPKWHQNVRRVITMPLRAWRKNLFHKELRRDVFRAITQVRAESYDVIIDAQGLLKSAVIAFLGKGKRAGYHKDSAREWMSSLFYKKTAKVAWEQHAIQRARELFAKLLQYPVDQAVPQYGIDWDKFPKIEASKPYIMFLHGTTWRTKHWPERYWLELAELVVKDGFNVKLTYATPEQQERAKRIAEAVPNVTVLPTLTLKEAAVVLGHSSGNIGVDTGFCHLSAALGSPTVSVYGPTDPIKTGALGDKQLFIQSKKSCAPCFNRNCRYVEQDSNLYPPCFIEITPHQVWQKLKTVMQ